MRDAVLRQIVGSVLVMLIVYQTGSIITSMVNVTAGSIGAVMVARVTCFCVYRANKKLGDKAWFLVPIVLFIFLPLAYRVWNLFSLETSSLTLAVNFTPLLVGFLLPVLLLLLVYAELRKRTIVNEITSPTIVAGPS